LEERTGVEKIVVDASVAVKWFTAEKDTDKALKLKDSYLSGELELIAPTLIYYEVANALRFHPYYRLTEKELFDAITALKEMQIAIEPTMEMWLKTFKISVTSEEISIYDAIYVAVSLALDTRLVTSDRKFVEKLNEDVKRRITLLSELSI